MTEITLQYAGVPQRIRITDASPWFAAKDVFAAHGRLTDRAYLAHFAPEHLSLVTFSSPQGPIHLTAVSPLGVATIAAGLPFPNSRMLDAWVRKRARMLSEEYGCAPLEMTLLADGRQPVKPRKYSAHEDDWYELTFQHQHCARRSADLSEPALFDDDPDLPAHDPEAVSPEFEAVRAAKRRDEQMNSAMAHNPLLRSIHLRATAH